MTNEEKTELIKAICGYLYDGLYVKDDIVGKDFDEHGNAVYSPVLYTYYYHPNIDNCKPYLRPLSSMTEEEKKEFIEYAGYDVEESVNGRHYEYYLKDYGVGSIEKPAANHDSIDWLNAHHFDYRGLIEKGLALEAQDGMYNN